MEHSASGSHPVSLQTGGGGGGGVSIPARFSGSSGVSEASTTTTTKSQLHWARLSPSQRLMFTSQQGEENPLLKRRWTPWALLLSESLRSEFRWFPIAATGSDQQGFNIFLPITLKRLVSSLLLSDSLGADPGGSASPVSTDAAELTGGLRICIQSGGGRPSVRATRGLLMRSREQRVK